MEAPIPEATPPIPPVPGAHPEISITLFAGIIILEILLVCVFASWKFGFLTEKNTVVNNGEETSTVTEDTGTSQGNYNSSDRFLTPQQFQVARLSLGSTTPKVLKDKYDLFVLSQPYEDIDTNGVTTYYEDGTLSSGTYAGYHVIIARITPYDNDGPGSSDEYYTFITKDYRSFIVFTPEIGKLPNPTWFNTARVVQADHFATHFPNTIPFGNFVLTKSEWFNSDVLYDHNNTSPVGTVELTSPDPHLKIFSEPEEPLTNLEDTLTKTLADAAAAYIYGRTTVMVRDEAGIGFVYSLSFAHFANPNDPAGRIPNTEYRYGYLGVAQNQPTLYSSYAKLIPYGCEGANSSESYVLKNISDADVRDTGIKWQGVELYAFANARNPLTEAHYRQKVAAYAAIYKNGSESATLDTLAFTDYIAKTPTLLFKDPWGRWVGVGEDEYKVTGGCGKPVIYLYPPQSTEVSVQFMQSPRFTTDIPIYENGWKVLAETTGALHDLQPALTPCETLATNVFGSEYAGAACKTNTYPYLFWAGQANGNYPTPTGGWIVEKANIESFLGSKLTELGLNDTERNDMLSFWVPQLMKKNSPYYRLAFFQTSEMNHFIPMIISPRPDSMLRLFLDWTPLSTLPDHLPQPQQLHQFHRSGFAVVEWGGLDR